VLLNIVTDDELLTSQVVKGILLCLIAVGIVFNFFKIIRTGPAKKKIINSVFFIILQYRIEGSLLKDPKYVQGKTIRFCNVFALGQGVLFEYEVNGQTYRCCNTFHPVPVDSILVPGGIFMVRYSDKFPEKGRMDFTKKINE